MLHNIFNYYIVTFGNLLHEFVVTNTAYLLGVKSINEISPLATITVTVDKDTILEPIPFSEIKSTSSNFHLFILNNFQNLYIQHWQGILDDIYQYFIDEHFSKNRPFSELRKVDVKIDFSIPDTFNDQIKHNTTDNFRFKEYSKRIKLINMIFHKHNECTNEVKFIYKHVLIRNAFQHGRNKIDDYIISKLGQNTIDMLDQNSTINNISLGDQINLSIPELYKLHKSILFTINTWRQSID